MKGYIFRRIWEVIMIGIPLIFLYTWIFQTDFYTTKYEKIIIESDNTYEIQDGRQIKKKRVVVWSGVNKNGVRVKKESTFWNDMEDFEITYNDLKKKKAKLYNIFPFFLGIFGIILIFFYPCVYDGGAKDVDSEGNDPYYNCDKRTINHFKYRVVRKLMIFLGHSPEDLPDLEGIVYDYYRIETYPEIYRYFYDRRKSSQGPS